MNNALAVVHAECRQDDASVASESTAADGDDFGKKDKKKKKGKKGRQQEDEPADEPEPVVDEDFGKKGKKKGKKGRGGDDDYDLPDLDESAPPPAEAEEAGDEGGGTSKTEMKRLKREQKKAAKNKKGGPAAAVSSFHSGGDGTYDDEDEPAPAGDGSPEAGRRRKDDDDNGVDAETGYRDMTVTGVLASDINSKDVAFKSFSVVFQGKPLVKDTRLELNNGRHYGLLGPNGVGKSTLLSAIGQREIPIPAHIDVYHLVKEVEPSNQTPMHIVSSCDSERDELQSEADRLIDAGEGIDDGRLEELYERLELLDVSLVEKRAGEILNGLGFTPETMKKPAKAFSGGWRMRISLARALFVSPQVLLLDEPTNHLDMESCLWLEERLSAYRNTLVIISHSQDFLNGVCDCMIYMFNCRLRYYNGNYDNFVKNHAIDNEAQQKKYEAEQKKLEDMRLFIERNSSGNQAKQAQSRQKEMDKMIAAGLTEAVVPEAEVTFKFEDCGKLPPPVMQFDKVSFHYPTTPDKVIYDEIELGIDCDSRVALVGPNGAGKSTLVKLMKGELTPTDGAIRKHRHLKIAAFTQHSAEMLDEDSSALAWMIKQFPVEYDDEDRDARKAAGQHENRMRGRLAAFGITGKESTSPMRYLSDGQKSRICFAHAATCRSHIILLDEPTNHLDIASIDALADALRRWDGGVVLVSHDFRLIGQVARDIWECRDQAVIPWKSDILAFKKYFREKYTPKDPNAKLVNREGGNSGMDQEDDGEVVDIRVDAWKASAKKLNYGDGLDQEKKGAAKTEAKRKKKGKGSRGETLDPIVVHRQDLTAKLADGVDAAEEWWVETIEENKLSCEVGVDVPFTVCLAQAWDTGEPWAPKVGEVAPLFKRLCNSTEGQRQMLSALCGHLRTIALDYMPEALHAFYDHDILDEDVLVRRMCMRSRCLLHEVSPLPLCSRRALFFVFGLLDETCCCRL